MDYKVTSFELKLALLEYFRFDRQWIAVDEFLQADVICDTGKKVIEVEVKVQKNDLCYAEKRKPKHFSYKEGRAYRRCHPNEFYFCVTSDLLHDANMVVEELNPKYGIIIFDQKKLLRHLKIGYHARSLSDYLSVVRRAKKLHSGYPEKQVTRIAKRCCAKNITLMQKEYEEKLTCSS